MSERWPVVRLGDLADVVTKGTTPTSVGHEFVDDGINFIKVESITPSGRFIKEKFAHITAACHADLGRSQLQAGDILFSIAGALGRTGFVTSDVLPANTNQALAIIRLKQGAGVSQEFVLKALETGFILEQIEKFKGGAAQQNLSLAQVRDFCIALPPLPEQQRIVALLDEAFAGLATAKANAERNLQNARALFESHLQSVFSQRGEGWVDRQLASLCTEITVGHVGPMKTEYKESGIPFLRSQNIRPFEVSMDNSMFIDKTFHRTLKKSQLRPGDLAIVRTGYPGTAAVIPPELPDSNCSDLVIVRPGEEIDPHFLAAFFNSAFGKQLVLGKIVGAAQKHFNITAAKEVMLRVPPMSEQLAIVTKSDELREETQSLFRLYERKLAALEKLKKSLLHQAFNGEL